MCVLVEKGFFACPYFFAAPSREPPLDGGHVVEELSEDARREAHPEHQRPHLADHVRERVPFLCLGLQNESAREQSRASEKEKDRKKERKKERGKKVCA